MKKIRARIRDAKNPEGWQESFSLSGGGGWDDLDAAKSYVADVVARFNAQLRTGEIPREFRPEEVELVDFTEHECFNMGQGAYNRGDETNPFPRKSDQATWFDNGFRYAHSIDPDSAEDSDY